MYVGENCCSQNTSNWCYISSANPIKNKPYYQTLILKLHNCQLSPAVGLGLGCNVDVRGGKLLLTERRCSIVVASALQQFSVATAIEKRWTWAASSTHWDIFKATKIRQNFPVKFHYMARLLGWTESVLFLKFIFSRKATKIDKVKCQIGSEDFPIFVAFLENTNFNWGSIKPQRSPIKGVRPSPFMLAWVNNVLTSTNLFIEFSTEY